MSAFAPLLQELDRWHDAGRTADLWLRDDDAIEFTAALEPLLLAATKARVAVVIAAIPLLATKGLAARLADEPLVKVWQHGISHINNAVAGSKKQELTSIAPDILTGLREGWQCLSHLFPGHAQPVLVPPWNRIAPELVACLPDLGMSGLSTFKPRQHPNPAGHLWQVNTHVDVIDWRADRKFIGPARTCNEITRHLAARRMGPADATEPTGILTHHLVMEESAWAFLSDLLALTNSHPAARWCVPNRE